MSRLLRVRVGSRNPAKLEAARRGLAPFFERIEVEGIAAASGVDEQPIGFAEIVAGARARAAASHAPGHCDLACGIEDGLIAMDEATTGYVNVGCAALFDGTSFGVGFTAAFEYPPDCVQAATANPRQPIGDAFDASFEPPPGWPPPQPGGGNIGALTGGVLTRAEYGAQAVTCAYLRFLHPTLYAEREFR